MKRKVLWSLLLWQAVSSVTSAPEELPGIYASSFQHHIQDDWGGYNYGYADINSAKEETRNPDGSVVGSYSYVDANNVLQTVNYVSDDVLGFRVAATNLPQAPQAAPAVPEVVPVIQTPAAPVVKAVSVEPQVYAATTNAHAQATPVQPQVYAPNVLPFILTNTQRHAQAVPVQPQVYAPNAVPISLTNTQHHAQTESGAYNYGYSNHLSSKQEIKTEDGITQGTYSYVDANGLVQTVNYVSDALGFRVSATNLPVAPVPEIHQEVKSAPVPMPEKTPAVAEFFKATDPIVPPVQAQPAPVVQAAPVVKAVPVQPQVYAPSAVPVAPVVQAAPVVNALPVQPQVYAPSAVPVVPVVQNQPVPVIKAIPVQPQVTTLVQDQPLPVVQVQAAPVQPQVYAPNAVPVSLTNTQYHSQTETGAYSYGYGNALSSKQESKSEDGITQGTYSYVDANGLVQTVNYVSDALGFRVSATNLPVAPAPPIPVPEEVKSGQSVVPETKVAQPVVVEKDVMTAKPTDNAHIVYAHSVYAPSAPTIDLANTQYHAQDHTFGSYNYGYSNPLGSKQEFKSPDGITQGSYSYVDAYGLLQTVNYVSDALGFRVAATNLPVAPVATAQNSYSTPAYDDAVYAVPVISPEKEEAPPATASMVDVRIGKEIAGSSITQAHYHTQDEHGQYQFGYADPYSNRAESKDIDGVVVGSYNYIDETGLPQTVQYVADEKGFHVTGSTIPVHNLEHPVPVQDTPEVVAAREAHLRAVSAARERHAKALDYFEGISVYANDDNQAQYNYGEAVTTAPSRNERKLTAASAASANLLAPEKEKPSVVTMTESYAKMQMYPILEEVELVVEEPAEENEDCEYC